MPRATANSSSTIRMVGHGAAILHRARRGGPGPARGEGAERACDSLARDAATGGMPVAPRRRLRDDRHLRVRALPPERFTTMPDRPRLAAASRTVTGKAVARLRKEGRLPAVVYGHGTPASPSSIDAHEFDQLRRHTGASTLIDLTVDGGKARPVLVHGVQVHPVTRRPLHVDLFVVRMTEELTVEVPLVGTGAAPASESGGTLVHPVSIGQGPRAARRTCPTRSTTTCRRSSSYDVTITVADLVAPEGVTIAADPADVVARVLAPRVEEVVAVAAAEEARRPARPPPRRRRRGRERRGRRRGLTPARLGRAAYVRRPVAYTIGSHEAQPVGRQRPQPREHVRLERGALRGLERVELVRVVEARDEPEERLGRELVVQALGVRRRAREPRAPQDRDGLRRRVRGRRRRRPAPAARGPRRPARRRRRGRRRAARRPAARSRAPGGRAGRSTRRISRSARWRDGTSWSTNAVSATSNEPSWNGSRSAGAWRKRIRSAAGRGQRVPRCARRPRACPPRRRPRRPSPAASGGPPRRPARRSRSRRRGWRRAPAATSASTSSRSASVAGAVDRRPQLGVAPRRSCRSGPPGRSWRILPRRAHRPSTLRGDTRAATDPSPVRPPTRVALPRRSRCPEPPPAASCSSPSPSASSSTSPCPGHAPA